MKIEKKHYPTIIIIVIILLLIIFFWDSIATFLHLDNKKKVGDPCKTSDNKDGKLDASGNCISNTRRMNCPAGEVWGFNSITQTFQCHKYS